MAHTKAAGTTKLGRDSESKRLGVKIQDGQVAMIGNIIIRQRGSKYRAGQGTRVGSDDTVYAVKKGMVKYSTTRKRNYDGNSKLMTVVSVV